MTVQDLLRLSTEAEMKGDMPGALAYAKEAADTGDEESRKWYSTLLLKKFMDTLARGDMQASRQAALECADAGSGQAIKNLVVSLAVKCETLEEVEDCLELCKRAEALGEDMTAERDMAEYRRRELAPATAPTAGGYAEQIDVMQAVARAQAMLQAKAAAPENGAWKCSCGVVNTGRFCAECGSPRES